MVYISSPSTPNRELFKNIRNACVRSLNVEVSFIKKVQLSRWSFFLIEINLCKTFVLVVSFLLLLYLIVKNVIDSLNNCNCWSFISIMRKRNSQRTNVTAIRVVRGICGQSFRSQFFDSPFPSIIAIGGISIKMIITRGKKSTEFLFFYIFPSFTGIYLHANYQSKSSKLRGTVSSLID